VIMGCKIQHEVTRAGIGQNRRDPHFMLKNISKEFWFSLVMVICLSTPGLSVYLHYNNVMEIDFASSSNFENIDLEDALWVEQQDPLKVCGPNSLSNLFFPDNGISNPVHYVPIQESTTFENTPILRC